MKQFVLPGDMSSIKTLLAKIIAKNHELGTESPIKNLLCNKNCFLEPETISDQKIMAANQAWIDFTFKETELIIHRNNLVNPVMQIVKGIAQTLKSYYQPNYSELSLWGITICIDGRITYPTDFQEQYDLVNKIKEKNDMFKPFLGPIGNHIKEKDIDLSGLVNDMNAALKIVHEIEKLKADFENTISGKKLMMDPIISNLKTIVHLLKNYHHKNFNELKNWGIKMKDSTPKVKTKSTKIKPFCIKTIHNVIIGGLLFNAGNVSILVYKGKTTNGEPIEVKAGKSYRIPAGYNTISIRNTSKVEKTMVKALVCGSYRQNIKTMLQNNNLLIQAKIIVTKIVFEANECKEMLQDCNWLDFFNTVNTI